MVRAFVGLGSNLGERRETLRAAVGRLRGLPEVEVKGVSSFRDTEPLAELDPDLEVPGQGSVQALLAKLDSSG